MTADDEYDEALRNYLYWARRHREACLEMEDIERNVTEAHMRLEKAEQQELPPLLAIVNS